MDKEKQLLKHCKYYKGDESDSPKDGDHLICWNTERAWFNRMLEAHVDDPFGLDMYIEAGLRNFRQYDGVPITLKAMLFSFISKLSEHIDTDTFKSFYETNYE